MAILKLTRVFLEVIRSHFEALYGSRGGFVPHRKVIVFVLQLLLTVASLRNQYIDVYMVWYA